MAGREKRNVNPNCAAIYARVSDKSQAAEDRTSISEQVADMEAYCGRRELTIVSRYQEVGRGWSKKRPEFQRMLEDARQGRFDTIVCWKSDRLSRGVYPAAVLMEVVEAYGITIESVMDSIDMKYFGLMAAIGKIEIDNFRERASMGKRGAAKRGRIPIGGLPYGYRNGEEGKAEVEETEAEVVRRIFRQYVYEDVGTRTIARMLEGDGVRPHQGGRRWHQSHVYRILGNETYKGVWNYGQTRATRTDQGKKVRDRPRETWIAVAVPPLVDVETWDRAQRLKKERLRGSRRNTKVFYLLQHMMRCAECGTLLGARSTWTATRTRNGKRQRYRMPSPRRYYCCYGWDRQVPCRERSHIRAERLERLVWREVSHVLRNPELILSGMDVLDSVASERVAEEAVSVEREMRTVQKQEDRVTDLYVTGRIDERQWERQRGQITERLEVLRTKLEYIQAQEAASADRRQAMESIVAWMDEVGDDLDGLGPEERRKILLTIVEGITVDRDSRVNITLAVPMEKELSISSQSSTCPAIRSRPMRPPSGACGTGPTRWTWLEATRASSGSTAISCSSTASRRPLAR